MGAVFGLSKGGAYSSYGAAAPLATLAFAKSAPTQAAPSLLVQRAIPAEGASATPARRPVTIGKRKVSGKGTYDLPVLPAKGGAAEAFGGGGAEAEAPAISSGDPIDIGPAGPPSAKPKSLLDRARVGFDVGIDAPDYVWYVVGAVVLAAGGYALYKRSRR